MNRVIAALAACVLLASPVMGGAAVGGPAPMMAPQGEPQPGGRLRDGEFGVTRRAFGLERRVEMHQWSAGEDGFRRVWNAAPIDSSGFPDNRQNPPDVPLDTRRWWSATATLDGRPIDVEVLKVLGDWQQFRPGFSRLPGNLAATFQPDGDGLSSSSNPLDPQIGDLRVTWHELVLPPLAGKVELRGGRWQLALREAPTAERIPADVRPVRSGRDVDVDVDGEVEDEAEGEGAWLWLLGAVAGLALLVALFFRRRRRRL